MRDSNPLLPFTLIALLLRGFAYLPLSGAPIAGRDIAAIRANGGDERPRTVIRELLARVTQTLFLATGGVLLIVGFLASMSVQSRQTLPSSVRKWALTELTMSQSVASARELIVSLRGSRASA